MYSICWPSRANFPHFFWAKMVITLHHVTDVELSKTLSRVVVKTIGIGGSKTVWTYLLVILVIWGLHFLWVPFVFICETNQGSYPRQAGPSNFISLLGKEVWQVSSLVLFFDSKFWSKTNGVVQGVNRAFPYVAADDVDVIIEQHTPVLFRLVYTLLSTHSMIDNVTEFQ